MYDVIVVGARCAGATTAMLLARRGHRVLLVDRSTFPSDLRLSTHLVWQPGIAALERWGLRDEVAASGCPALTTAALDVGPFTVTGSMPAADGIREAYAPRRVVLDAILVAAAVAAGAELWEGCTVDELLTDDDTGAGPRVHGIRGHLRGGRTVSATATIVVGADGMRSPVAATVGAPTYLERPARQGTYFTYWSGLPGRVPTLYPRAYRSVVTTPTNDDLTMVAVNWVIDDYRSVRRDIEGEYHRAVAEIAPELAEQLRAGRREDRWIGAAVPSRFRRPFGPGWALVGDAGYVKDPCTAQGITDAFHHAELLTEALDDGLRGRRPVDDALADYERRRNAAAMPMYEFTYATSALEPPTPQEAELFGAMRDDPALTERFLGLFAGTVSPQDFFAPLDAAA
ncbi:MAG: oxidoreductase [Actinomycetospora sp.]|jgi:2-polyprenyl-6-methoxyphenol hydroxylase-like FAD-dependent oxidoreductase|nr:oxidoreductase [Actinomycetospora sp.]